MALPVSNAADPIWAACRILEQKWKDIGYRIWQWNTSEESKSVYYIISIERGRFKKIRVSDHDPRYMLKWNTVEIIDGVNVYEKHI